MKFWFSILAALFAVILPIPAQEEVEDPFALADEEQEGSPFGPNNAGTVTATLVGEADFFEAGKPFTVGLKMVHGRNLHTYWVNPGETGNPTTISFTLPEGFTAGPLIYGLPHVLEEHGKYFNVFEGTALHLVTITPPDTFTAGQKVEIKAQAKWLQCDDKGCRPGKADLSLTIRAAEKAEYDPASQGEFDKVRAAQPQGSAAWEVAMSADGFVVTLTPREGATADPGELYFFDANEAIEPVPPTLSRADGKLILTLTKKDGTTKMPGGFILAKNGWDQSGLKALAVGKSESLPAAATDSSTGSEPAVTLVDAADLEKGYVELGGYEPVKPTIWIALLWALIGGVILNLMPCVFPVLGLKVLSFVKMGGENPRKVLFHGLAFAAGVIVFVWLLAAIIIFTKSAAGGESVTWGFQLKSPWFMAFIVALMFAIGLNLSGVFEMGTSLTQLGGAAQGKKGYMGSFFSGALTTLVSTPCTGPFMAGAIGWAFSQTNFVIFIILTVLGIGISLPYVVLSASPPLLKLLPRPGPWMETFKKIVAFPAYAAAVYFLNAFGQLCGLGGASWLLFSLVLLAIALFIYGHWCTPYLSLRSKSLGGLAALGFTVWAGFITTDAIRNGVAETLKSDGFWEVWTPEKEVAARREGKIVFIDYTTPG